MKSRQKKIESSLSFFKNHSNCDLDYCIEIDSKIEGKTVITIAHRKTTIDKSERVIDLEEIKCLK